VRDLYRVEILGVSIARIDESLFLDFFQAIRLLSMYVIESMATRPRLRTLTVSPGAAIEGASGRYRYTRFRALHL
jgi:hypothetical protein